MKKQEIVITIEVDDRIHYMQRFEGKSNKTPKMIEKIDKLLEEFGGSLE